MKKVIVIIAVLVCCISVSAQTCMYKERASGIYATVSLDTDGVVLNMLGSTMKFPYSRKIGDFYMYQEEDDTKNGLLMAPNCSCFTLMLSSTIYYFDLATVGSSNPYGSYGGYGSSGGGSATYQQTCTLCHGKGWIAGSKTPTYGSGGTYFCTECGRDVYASHSHDRCPSCSGTGQITRIR